LPVNYVDPDDLDQFIGDARLNPVRAAQRLPPCLILVGETDWALAQSRLLRDALVAHRVEHQYAEIPDTPHGFTLLPGHHGYGSSWRKVLEFLDHKIGP
jgi:acetyl esterase/lipase